MTESFRVVPAAYVLLLREHEVLLQLRRNTGYMDEHWAAAAAGHVEAGETVFAAAVREAHEEIGVTIDADDLVPLCGMHRTHRNGRPIDERVDFFFSCSVWRGEPRLAEPDKAADLRWFALDALPDPVVPHELSVISTLLDGGPPAVVAFGF